MNEEFERELIQYFRGEIELKHFSDLFNNNPNERDAVILGVSYIETLMNEVLSNFLPKKSKTVDKMLDHRGFVGTLNSKTDLAYVLGLINRKVKTDLDIIAQIRNQFAHNFKTTFEKKEVIQLCEKLKWYEDTLLGKAPKGASAFDKFKVDINQIIGYLQGKKDLARTERRKIDNG